MEEEKEISRIKSWKTLSQNKLSFVLQICFQSLLSGRESSSNVQYFFNPASPKSDPITGHSHLSKGFDMELENSIDYDSEKTDDSKEIADAETLDEEEYR